MLIERDVQEVENLHRAWERNRRLYETNRSNGRAIYLVWDEDAKERIPTSDGTAFPPNYNVGKDGYTVFVTDMEDIARMYGYDLADYYDCLWAELRLVGFQGITNTEGFFAGNQWSISYLSYEEINELAVDAQMGEDRAKELLCIYCGRMVHKIVNSFRWAFGRGLEMMDLYQAGMVGLLISLEKWDYEYEVDFMGWAKWRVYAEITKTITNDGPLVRLPRDWQLLRGRLPKIRAELEAELGDKASYEELAEFIYVMDYYPRKVSPQRLAFLETYHVSSSNEEVSDDEDNVVEKQDLYESEEPDPAEVVGRSDLVNTLLTYLTDEERLIVENAKEGMGKMTFQEIAEELLPYSPRTDKPVRSETVANRFHKAIFKMKGAALTLGIEKEEALSK